MIKKTFTLLLLIIILGSIVYFSLAAKYNYDVTQDYRYALQNSQHTTRKTLLKQGKFSFENHHNADTGFIKLKLATTFSGYFSQPYIEIISLQQRSILSFERGVRGVRYINLPVAQNTLEQTIQLIPHHLTIANQQASILLFSNPLIHQKTRVLVIAPHPDDAEIAAFGLYSQHHSLILTLTAGEAGAFTYDEIYPDAEQHYRIKGKLRVWNSITVPMLGGVTPEYAINLGYFDGTLEQMANNKSNSVHSIYTHIDDVNHFRRQNLSSLTPKSAGMANWSSLISDLKQILKTFTPDIIVTPYPALDWHSDHKFATIALISAIQDLNLQHGQLFLYTNHFTANNYFPYGQQGELASISPDFNQSLYFDSIYSLQLRYPREKIFALEAMNDLRLDTSWLNITGAWKILAKTIGNKLLMKDKSYFRRAVRANELFLVVNFSSLYQEKVIDALTNDNISQ